MTRSPHQKGFSIIELMVAITLGILLLVGVVEVFIGSKQTYRTQEAFSRLQENARYALDIISKDIRMAGFIGCKNLSEILPNPVVPTLDDYNSSGVFWGNDSTETGLVGPTPDNFDASLREAFTDVLVVQSVGQCSVPIKSDMANETTVVSTENPCEFEQNDVVMIADCKSADIFRISNTPLTQGTVTYTANNDLNSLYKKDDGSELMSLSSNVYFIGRDPISNLPSLFVIDNTAPTPSPEVLVEGVESMQIQYGIDTNEDDIPDSFVNTIIGTGHSWEQVLVARVTLLMRTLENLQAQAYEFNVGGTDFDPFPAGPIRREFVATVKIRNRAL